MENSPGYLRTVGQAHFRLAYAFLAMLTTKWGWALIGIGLLIGGLVWGLNSYQVTYEKGQPGMNYATYVGEFGNIYFRSEGSTNYFVARPADFNQEIDTNVFKTPGTISFIARTDTIKIDANLNGTHIQQAHMVEKLVVYDLSGHQLASYMTPEYKANPGGYTVNNWPYASLLMLAGVLVAGIMLFFIIRARQRQKQASAAKRVELENRPSPFARELAND